MPLKLAIVIGSTRPGRVGPSVAAWFLGVAREHGAFDVTLIDLADLDLPLLDEPHHPSKQLYQHAHTKRWAELVADADAFVFVTPEYDYFAPAGLVNAIQYLSKEWKYKAAGIVSYGGISGGLRSTQMVRLLLSNLDAHPLKDSVSVQFIGRRVADGVFTPDDHAPKAAHAMLDELHTWSAALAGIRGVDPS
jgi:NAD(P)H-dependent FMN reductase